MYQVLYSRCKLIEEPCSILEQPGFDASSVNITQDGDESHVSWDPPTGDFTRVILYQCHDRDDEYDACIAHDVINVTSLTVRRSDGDWLTLVWWQDRDDVLVHTFTIDPDYVPPGSSDDGM